MFAAGRTCAGGTRAVASGVTAAGGCELLFATVIGGEIVGPVSMLTAVGTVACVTEPMAVEGERDM